MTSAIVRRLCLQARSPWPRSPWPQIPVRFPTTAIFSSAQCPDHTWTGIHAFCTLAKESLTEDESILEQLRGLTSGVGVSSLQLESALQELKRHAAGLSPRSVSVLLHRCKVGGHYQPQTIKTLVHAAEERAKSKGFSHMEAAAAVQSLASIVRSARGELPKSLQNRILNLVLDMTREICSKDRMAGITDRALANLMYGLGVLFKNDADAMERDPRLKFCVERLTVEICKEHQLVSFTQQGLANIVYAYGCLGWRSDVALLRLSREIINRICGFKSQEIANTVLALSKLDFRNEELILTLGVEAASPHRASVFTEQEFCNVLSGLTKLTMLLPSMEKFDVVFERLSFQAGSHIRLKKYNGQDLASLLQSIAIISQKLPQKPHIHSLALRLVDRFNALLDGRERNHIHLPSVIHSCAKLQLQDHEFPKKVNEGIADRRWALNSVRTVTLLLWGLSSLKALTPRAFLILCQHLCTLREKGDKILDLNWVQLTQAIQFMEQHPETVELTPQIKDLLEEALSVRRT